MRPQLALNAAGVKARNSRGCNVNEHQGLPKPQSTLVDHLCAAV